MVFKRFYSSFLLLAVLTSLVSCGTYKKSVMLQMKDESITKKSNTKSKLVNGHYPILVNDKIELKVYSNKGELLIDPNTQFKREFVGLESGQKSSKPTNFLVEKDSTVYLPMVGKTKVVGYSKNQLDSLLIVKYANFYEEPFVSTKVVSRKVYITGNIQGQEILLEDENMNLLEVLALSGYEGLLGRTDNIKIVRGNEENREVLIVDLSTKEGMLNSNLTVFPNDVIYIQPRRKTFSEGMRDAAVFVSILTSTITLLVLISR